MFGYIVTNQAKLSDEEKEIYHSYYCGLCHSIKKEYGSLATTVHSNDMTFLTILLSGLYEPDTLIAKESCSVHPLKKHLSRENIYSIYSAKMTIILSYYKCLDDVHDEGKHKMMLKKLTQPFQDVSQEFPDKIKRIDEALKTISSLEKENCDDLDLLCNTFGKVMGEIVAYDDPDWSEELYTLGYNMGKFIYLMDAYDDIESDIKKNQFNPFKKKYSQKDFDTQIHDLLEMFMSEATLAFERLPIIENSGILRNILYSGVWSRYTGIQEKRNKKKEEAS